MKQYNLNLGLIPTFFWHGFISVVGSYCFKKSARIYWDHLHYFNKGKQGAWLGGVKYWLLLKIFAKYWISWIKSLRISLSPVIFVLFKYWILWQKYIPNIAWKNRYVKDRIKKTANIAYSWLLSRLPYKLLVLQMDNSIADLFDSAMFCFAPNCRTKNTWLWSQVISHTFCRTKDTYAQHQMHIQNRTRSLCEKVKG